MPAYALSPMKRAALLLAAAMAAVVLLIGCSSDDDPVDSAPLTGTLGSASVVYDTNSGIHASGIGTVTAEPDIAIVTLGVEALHDSVTAARDDAARSLAAIVDELRAAGIADEDIRTAYFSIDPRYQYVRDGEQELLGFQVTNTLNVTVRDPNAAGDIVDRAVSMGGDFTRVNSVSLQIEDTTALEEQARVLAIEDAVEKADLYATHLNVARGSLVSIAESSFDAYPIAEARFSSFAMDSAASVPTQFFGGEMEVTVRVQAIFAIE